ncbi:phosphohistidine phosphatase SixA [Solemya velum gill symbiont]|uniref:Phosphohistidine phosphatase SixA n=1 Tax=Solemya velum gill symbiont TaxID=2340 RepID=A0A0B0HB32_SOVGS|nr:phosphohistidine phosphatase SixA [Solemya velum gill symbiont]KHF25847.1 phosphohistidine phosphatase SixA [Solemya velum gill symbiont]OOY34548.1 phosphohistidine phosphatase SixA [Solemya velum gill symbiont]OOY37263.1 phosphohistidine phosphatase SixA [Solemya velum gill symbiont]OOY40494.1 phosphohistidine phosphatase SixA [Solemya velum gill symbiont]OOY41365.1 phosphohistidine phosphatase SixA [Solemya velum gill symbiont]
MKLYLAQHGDAVGKMIDPERPLSGKGKEDVSKMADFLTKAGVRVDRVIHSGKLRAQQTASILARSIAPGVPVETSGFINPNDDPASFHWERGGPKQDILVVGHLPFMEKLVAHLVTGDMERDITDYDPGSVVCLEYSHDSWQIIWMLNPGLLA